MADLSGVIDNYFTVASETFTDNLSSSISAGAVTVPVNNNSEYTNGDCVVLTVDPGTVNEATFIGKKSGLNFIECIWTEGNTAVGHSNGATIIDYDSATHHSAQSKGILQFANPDGTLLTQPIRDALGLGATAANGWEVSPYTYSVASGYNKGNREFDITISNADVTDEYSVGQRLKFTRGTTPNTQCTDLELSSSQYASRASGSVTGTLSTITDDMTAEAWVRQESNVGTQTIASRFSAAGTSGWRFDLVTGRPQILGTNAGALDNCISYISIPLLTWTHVAASLDMSGASGVIHINGISVLTVYTNGAATAWTNVSNDLCIGAATSGSLFFDGKITDVRLWNVIRTTTQIRDNMYQALTGSETNLIGYWQLNGNFNDSTSSANNLTAQGGATATTFDYPYTATEYAIITKLTYGAPHTTATVVTSNAGGIPNQTLTAPYYSAQRTPYGFPAARSQWLIEVLLMARQSAAGTASTWVNLGQTISVPTGEWRIGYNTHAIITHGGTTFLSFNTTLSTGSTTETDVRLTARSAVFSASSTEQDSQITKEGTVNLSSQTVYYFNIAPSVSTSNVYIGDTGTLFEPGLIYAENMYV